jgi:DNA-binding transcriptional MerR regulator
MSEEEKEAFPPEQERMSLAELTEEADVSVRTVRYYIGEGLLPPPAGAGPGSAYGRGHLDRLRLIQRMKAAYLPLKEIRRRLAGLSDDDVRALLAAEEERMPAMLDESVAYDASLAGAREYLSLLESGARYRTEPLDLAIPSLATRPASDPEPVEARLDIAPDAARNRGPRAAGVVHARREPPRAGVDAEPGDLWHRIPLGDEAELVISERVYGRHRDRVDWLVRWARKVFG